MNRLTTAIALSLASASAVSAPSMSFNITTGNVVGLMWDCGAGASDALGTGPASWAGVKAVSGTASAGPITDTAVFGLKCNYGGKTSIALSATAPTLNTDGTPLTDFAGYKVYRGPAAANLALLATVPTTGNLSYTDSGLAAGTYFYAVTAYNASGVESAKSAIGSGTATATSSLTASVKITVPAAPGGGTVN